MKPYYCTECGKYKFGRQIKFKREMVGYETYAVKERFCKKCGCKDIKDVKHEITKLITGAQP